MNGDNENTQSPEANELLFKKQNKKGAEDNVDEVIYYPIQKQLQ